MTRYGVESGRNPPRSLLRIGKPVGQLDRRGRRRARAADHGGDEDDAPGPLGQRPTIRPGAAGLERADVEQRLTVRASRSTCASLSRVLSCVCVENILSDEATVANQLASSTGFEWDDGNAEKSWARHRVSRSESEQVFFNQPFIVHEDPLHSDAEDRFYALGQTDSGRELFVVFTLRGELIRVISARDMTPKERRRYQDVAALEADPEV